MKSAAWGEARSRILPGTEQPEATTDEVVKQPKAQEVRSSAALKNTFFFAPSRRTNLAEAEQLTTDPGFG